MKLRIEQDGRLRRIALASPENRNLLDAGMCQDLLREVQDGAADSETGAILIEADGHVFCSGVQPGAGDELYTIGRELAKPLIAAVRGVAVSGGLALIANAHVVIAAQGTSFGLTDIRDGKWNEPVYRAVAAAMGERRALELSLTGRIFSAQDALDWGLVHMVTPAFELDDRATAIGAALSNSNSDALLAVLTSARPRRITDPGPPRE